MSITRWVKRNPIETAGMLTAVAALGLAFPGMMQQTKDMGEVSREIQRRATEQQRLEAQQDALRDRAKIAELRYANGCLIVQLKGANTLTNLAQDVPVQDSRTGQDILPGTIVCDYAGNTAVMVQKGDRVIPSDTAFTGSRDYINLALKRSGIKLLPSSPDYGTSTRTLEGQ